MRWPPALGGVAPGADSHVEAASPRVQGQVLRWLLITFIVLTTAIAAIGLAVGSLREAAISATGAAVYGALLIALPRLGPRRGGLLTTVWYFLLATAAMASGRGIYDVTMVLFPAGMLMGALLLDGALLLPLVAVATGTVAVVGSVRAMGVPAPAEGAAPAAADVVVMVLLLAVSGVLTGLVVRSLRAMVGERRRAEAALLQSKAELEARNQALELVNSLASRLHRGLDLPAIAAETVEVLLRHSQPPMVAFYVLEDDGASLRLVTGRGFTEEEFALGATLPVEGSLSGVAVRERRLVTSLEVGSDERLHRPMAAALAARGISTAVAAPLVYGGRALGTINLIYAGERPQSTLDLETFQAIGQAVSVAVANARHVAGLEHQAFHDALTGLPNRASLHRRFETHLEAARSERGIGLVIVDLNHFRHVNEALGHHLGDELLVRIAGRLAGAPVARGAELFRLGSDEFAFLVPGLGADGATSWARGVLAALAEPVSVGGMELEVTGSAGIALCPLHGRDSDDLLRCADVATEQARRAGGVAVYSRDLDEHTPERLAMRAELGAAVREGGLALHFQPRVRLATGAVIGFEALVRWPHPRHGLLLPAEFLPMAEGDELLHPLTYWVVESALRHLRQWQRQRRHLTMAVNLSVRNLMDRSCTHQLEEIIRRTGVDPGTVEFELTETAVMADPESAMAMLGRLTDLGARLAIDDFGTGQSSLAYLQRLPVHVVKIDRSFVSGLERAEPGGAIVRATVQLAHTLGLVAAAEGVERPAEAQALREIGCDLAQGFYFSPAAPPEAIAAMVASGSALPPAPA